jgi:hypothetical protein
MSKRPFDLSATAVPGGVSLSFSCKSCGLPLSKTSYDFGMDCANDCGRKAEAKAGTSGDLVRLMERLKGLG